MPAAVSASCLHPRAATALTYLMGPLVHTSGDGAQAGQDMVAVPPALLAVTIAGAQLALPEPVADGRPMPSALRGWLERIVAEQREALMLDCEDGAIVICVRVALLLNAAVESYSVVPATVRYLRRGFALALRHLARVQLRRERDRLQAL